MGGECEDLGIVGLWVEITGQFRLQLISPSTLVFIRGDRQRKVQELPVRRASHALSLLMQRERGPMSHQFLQSARNLIGSLIRRDRLNIITLDKEDDEAVRLGPYSARVTESRAAGT